MTFRLRKFLLPFNALRTLACGVGVPKNYKSAIKWYRLAAEQWNGVARENLGWMYLKGEGVPQNYIYAYMWGDVAADAAIFADTNFGWEVREAAAKNMTPADISAAKKLARECSQREYKGC